MPLKYKFKTKHEIPTEHLPLYAEREGAWVLDVDGAVEKTKLDEFRNTNVSLIKERDDLKKRYEGIAPYFMKDEAFNQQDKALRRYLKPDLVIIDDMGPKALPKQSGEYLLEVVMRRYENRSTIMTSNRPLEDWGKLLSDVPAAGAILDRFLHHAITMAITGRSHRVKDSLRAGAPETRKTKKFNEPSTAEGAS